MAQIFLCDALPDRYGAPRSKREELQLRIANLRVRAGWSDHDEREELQQAIREAEAELAAIIKIQTRHN